MILTSTSFAIVIKRLSSDSKGVLYFNAVAKHHKRKCYVNGIILMLELSQYPLSEGEFVDRLE